MKGVWLSSVCMATAVSSCFYNPPNLRSPRESIAEIKSLGVTMTTEDRPFPEELDAIYHPAAGTLDAYVRVGALSLYLSPDPDFATSANGTLPYEEYAYVYSVESDDDFGQIEAAGIYNPVDRPSNSYSGVLRETDSVPELVVVGEFILQDVFVSVPASATHLELWLTENEGEEARLVRRIELDDLVAWRTYIRPVIDANAV